MKKEAKKKPEPTVQQRNKYTTEQKDKARKYYLMGLNLHEIGILLNGCPVRTLEKWQLSDKWTDLKQPESLKYRVWELHESGKSYSDIAKLLKISRVTVWRYIKEVRETTLN
jgi:Fic family protein